MKKPNQNLIIGGVVLVAVVVVGGIIYFQKSGLQQDGLSSQEISDKVLSYIAESMPDSQASVLNIFEENGLYKFTLQLNGQEFISYASKDGKLLFPQAINLEEEVIMPEAVEEPGNSTGELTLSNFSVSQNDVCQENGKPIIYFFGSETCPHCVWEHPIVEKVASEFGEAISFHNNMDTDTDKDIFSQYSSGGIPTLVLGCKYYRVGSGQSEGEQGEERNLTALICKLTGNQPAQVCDSVKDLIDQI